MIRVRCVSERSGECTVCVVAGWLIVCACALARQHFHYGYLLYSIAVVAKFRPSFSATHKAPILAIARDIASIDANEYVFECALSCAVCASFRR